MFCFWVFCGFLFLRFAISVKICREVRDFVFRTWERLRFEGIYAITLTLYIYVMYNTKLNFSPFGIVYGLILTLTLFFHFRNDAQL